MSEFYTILDSATNQHIQHERWQIKYYGQPMRGGVMETFEP
jgi:hypothetical protein